MAEWLDSVQAKSQGKAEVRADEDLATLFESHRKYLLRYALFLLRDPSLAEDVVQDTLLAAFAQRDRFEGRSQLRTWLTSILKHKTIDLVRRRARGLPVDVMQLGEDDSSSDGPFNARGRWIDPPADWGLPDAALESRQFWEVYRICCDRMPERYALVFSMREVMDLSPDEICNELRISKSNLHVILYRARQKLRSCMTKNWFSGDHE